MSEANIHELILLAKSICLLVFILLFFWIAIKNI